MPRLITPRFTLAWAVGLFQGLAFFLFVHFPGFLEDLGASEVEIGLIVGTTALTAILVRPWIGQSMDRRGRRPVILVGNVINVVVLALYPTIAALGVWVYAVRALHGIAAAMLFASIFTYAADIVPVERRTQGLALFGVSGLLPIALGGVVGDVILDRAGFDALFYTSVGLAVVGLLLSLPLKETVEGVREGATPFTAPLRQRDLLPMWWLTLVFSFALTAYFTFLRTFVDETGIGTVGAFFAAYSATAIALRLVGGALPDRVGPKRVLYPALLVFASGFLVLSAAGSTPAVVIAGTLCGAGHGYAFPIMYSLAFGRARHAERGSASAIFTGLFDVGTLAGGPTLGLLIASFGYSTMFVAAAACVLAGGLVFAWWDGDLSGDRTTRVSLG